MRNIQPEMNVGKQRRKLMALYPEPPIDPAEALTRIKYVNYLLGLFDDAVLAGQPQPASQFILMFEEEFGC